MSIKIFDFEVTRYDWLAVFKDIETGKYGIFHNDPETLETYLTVDPSILCGFNVKNYDQFILKAVRGGFSPEEIKAVNDYIIHGGNGWQYEPLRGVNVPRVDIVDLMDDCQAGLSLKAIEAHFGMDITESSVDFNIDHPWTKQELDEMVFYCKADVDATEKLYHLRENYLKNKIYLGKLKGIPAEKAMYMTNAKLTAAYLGAQRQEHDDEREYVIPGNLRLEYIPKEVLEFFSRMKDPKVSDEELFGSKLNIQVGECPVTIGWGGIHGAILNYSEEGE